MATGGDTHWLSRDTIAAIVVRLQREHPPRERPKGPTRYPRLDDDGVRGHIRVKGSNPSTHSCPSPRRRQKPQHSSQPRRLLTPSGPAPDPQYPHAPERYS